LKNLRGINFFKRIIIILLVCISSNLLRGQTLVDSTLIGRRISKISVTGNRKTKSEVIFREMELKQGSVLDIKKLESDRKRIENLLAFNRVVITGNPDSSYVALAIKVTEQIYFIPFPILFINDRDWNKLSFGAGFIHTNFLGRTDKLGAIFWAGYNPAVHFVYSNPWIGKKYNLLTKIEFFYARIRNKHFTEEKVYEYQKGFEWNIGKRWGHHLYGQLNFGYRSLDIDGSNEDAVPTEQHTDNLPEAGFSVMYDKRDLIEYPRSGYVIKFLTKTSGWPSQNPFYQRAAGELRIYIPFAEKSTFALRTKLITSINKVPVYDRYYFGYSDRIRGHFREIYEGDMLFLSSIGFRFPILGVRYFNITSLSQLHDLKFGIYGSLFIDTGAVWFKEYGLKKDNFLSGAGFGIHLILPYIHVIRFDYAVNEQGKTQFIVDLGVDI